MSLVNLESKRSALFSAIEQYKEDPTSASETIVEQAVAEYMTAIADAKRNNPTMDETLFFTPAVGQRPALLDHVYGRLGRVIPDTRIRFTKRIIVEVKGPSLGNSSDTSLIVQELRFRNNNVIIPYTVLHPLAFATRTNRSDNIPPLWYAGASNGYQNMNDNQIGGIASQYADLAFVSGAGPVTATDYVRWVIEFNNNYEDIDRIESWWGNSNTRMIPSEVNFYAISDETSIVNNTHPYLSTNDNAADGLIASLEMGRRTNNHLDIE